MFPASPEKIAPTIKAGIISQLVVSTTNDIPKSAADATMTKKNNNLYSAFKKAKAPFLMAELIDTIFSFPGSCFFTHWALKYIYTSPSNDNTIGIKIGLKFMVLIF